MVEEQTSMGRRVVYILIVAVILAGLAMVVAGFATERFFVTGVGLVAIVVATLTLIVVRPQQTNWSRRLGVGLATSGGVFFLGSLLGRGAFPSVVYLVVIAVGVFLLLRQRIPARPISHQQGVQ